MHFMRNLLSVVPRSAQDTVAAIVRTIFAQADHPSAMAQLREVVAMLQPKFPGAVALLEDAAADVLAHMHFPREHRRRLHHLTGRDQTDTAPSRYRPRVLDSGRS